MNNRCALTVVVEGDSRGLDLTVESALCQDLVPALEIIIVVIDSANTLGTEHLNFHRKHPWALRVQFLETCDPDIVPLVLAKSDADCFCFTGVRDYLYPNAIDSLLQAMDRDNSSMSLGACHWGNKRFNWSHPNIDQFFTLPAVIHASISVDKAYQQKSGFGLYSRKALETDVGQAIKEISIVYEYVGRRTCPGNPTYRKAYRKRGPYPDVSPRRLVPVYPETTQIQKRPEGLWLIGERAGHAAEDNGWALFQHCRDNDGLPECYFVLDRKSTVLIPRRYRDYVLFKGSQEWASALEQTSHILFTDSAADVLLDWKSITEFKDRTFVYLTHGVLAYSPGVYQKEHWYIDYVVCSSELDVRAGYVGWGFSPAKFIQSGLPRYDKLKPGASGSGEILFCPTWRKSINTAFWAESDNPEEDDLLAFKNSKYFKCIASLLHSRELRNVLVDFGLHINLRIHFRLQKYRTLFLGLANDRIRIYDPASDSRTLATTLQDCSALITDYSSVMWDVAFMEKPVICYQFDKPAMLSERRRAQFCLQDDHLVAEVCHRETEVLASLERLAGSNFELSREQRKVLNKLVPDRSGNNCANLVDTLRGVSPTTIGKQEYDVAVVIPVFNGEDHIRRCLESVLTQSFSGSLQLIVVDDGSTDGTSAILEEYRMIHDNLSVIRQKNSRQGIARNKGIQVARSTWISFVDADDVLPPDAIAELHRSADIGGTEVAIGLVASWHEGSSLQRINQAYLHYMKAPKVISSQSWPNVFYDPSCVGKIFSREFLIQNQLFFPQTYHEDQAFCFSLFTRGANYSICKNIVYIYVERPGEAAPSGTQTFSSEKLRQILNVGLKAAKVVKEVDIEVAISDHAVGFLLMRYDRFLWKRSQSADSPAFEPNDWQEIYEKLAGILALVPDQVVYQQCRYNCMALLCIKHDLPQLALDSLLGEDDAALHHFRESGKLNPETLDQIESKEMWKETHNYYRGKFIGPCDKEFVTDMSYGYRLGSIFMNAYKNPVTVILAPARLGLLMFDMVTRRGRAKQDQARKAKLRKSMQELLRHSDYIETTMDFKLGVALMEGLTHGPAKFIGLPKRVADMVRKR